MRKFIQIIDYLVRFAWSKVAPLNYAKYLGVNIGNNVHFYGMKPNMFSTEPWLISIGNDVYVTADVTFVTHDGGPLILRKEVPDLELTAPIVIGNDVYIGIRSIILPGTCIGNRSIIGAGSIVKGKFPDNSVIAGVPARVIRTVDEYLEKAKSESLGFGNLSAKEKEKALRRYFHKE